MKVNAIEINDDKKESDKDSEGNSMEKLPTKIRKFVAKESDHKAFESDLKDQTSDSCKKSIEGEYLDNDFQLESDILGKNGNSDGSNNGNVEKPVGKSASKELDERESDDTNDEEKLNKKEQTTEKTNNKENEQKENIDEKICPNCKRRCCYRRRR